MKMGTKSLLFGVHQFIWHPITVFLAWRYLYGMPTWKEAVCIFIHDLGYWGSSDMDGEEGIKHPEWAARWAYNHLDRQYEPYDLPNVHFIYYDLCLYHSRNYARMHSAAPSKLCWADKFCYKYDPVWFYVIRAELSGEIAEYRNLPNNKNFKGTTAEWYRHARDVYIKMVLEQQQRM